jgi:hypothetical protein
MDAGVGAESERLRHETRGDEGGTKDSAINGAVELKPTVADNGVTESSLKYLLEVAVDHGLYLGKIAIAIESDFQFKFGLDVV